MNQNKLKRWQGLCDYDEQCNAHRLYHCPICSCKPTDKLNKTGTGRSYVGDILADFEQDHDEEKAINGIFEEIDKARQEERERLRLRFDAIINAHLWGDYGFSGREMWKEANNLLDELKKSKSHDYN